ncbi:MAG: glycosyltransferase family 2 protein [Candidatus Marinarcus sp.]|uniref:glycosyltransferase family 2 protein n=1 Tax=Candidatus Marinarcus sp. TaxID=3100987 RepID=UPI003B00C3B9
MNTLVSVVIDNYNYEKYIANAIDSVLNQSYENYEIIVVDDGSTDSSKEIINSYTQKEPTKIKAIFKENGGQASAFNIGIKEIKGELICFLDSDDEFESNKLEEIVALYEQGYEYIFNDHTMIFDNNAPKGYEPIRYPYNGQNLFLLYYISKYVGGICSTLSISKKIAEQIFPIEDENGWRIQADDVIVYMSAMLTQSYFSSKRLTRYRIHGNNGYYNKAIPNNRKFERLKRIGTLKKKAVEILDLDEVFFKNSFNLVAEFKTHDRYDYELLKLYTRVLFLEMHIPFLKKLIAYKDIVKFYLENKKS